MAINRNELLGLMRKEVEVPVAGGTIKLREMTAGDRIKLAGMIHGKNAVTTDYASAVLLFTICNDDGSRMFADDEIQLVQSLPASIVEAAFVAASKLNNTDEKEAEKN